jgi:hypothetical protein
MVADHALGEAAHLGALGLLDSISSRFDDVAIVTNSGAVVTAMEAVGGAEAIGVMHPATPNARTPDTRAILSFMGDVPFWARTIMAELTSQKRWNIVLGS